MQTTGIIKLGVIAGKGDLPLILKSFIKRHNISHSYCNLAKEFKIINQDHIEANVFDIDRVRDFFIQQECSHVCIIGSIDRPSNLEILFNIRKFFPKISSISGDNSILSLVKRFFEEKNLKIIGIEEIIPDLVLGKTGLICGCEPNNQDISDIKRGKEILDILSLHDIGQSLIIDNGRVIGIEAAEGTDELIRRCSAFRPEHSGILVKSTKIGQHNLDLPTIGFKTSELLIKYKYKGMAISGNCLIVDREKIEQKIISSKFFLYKI